MVYLEEVPLQGMYMFKGEDDLVILAMPCIIKCWFNSYLSDLRYNYLRYFLWVNLNCDVTESIMVVIRVSLSEPHTSVTTLRMCVYLSMFACLDQPLTVNFKWAHLNTSWRSRREAGDDVRVQCRRPGVKTTEVEACVATSGLCFYQPSMPGHSQAVQI